MRRSRLHALQALPFLLLSTACAGPAVPVVVRREVPPALLACQAQPEPPDPGTDDAALAVFLIDLATAGDDCRAKLGKVRDLLNIPPKDAP